MYLLNDTISYQMAVCLFIWQANISIFIYVETWELYYKYLFYQPVYDHNKRVYA